MANERITSINSMGMGGRVRTFFPKEPFLGYEYIGDLSFTFTPEADIDPNYEYTGTLTYGFKSPDTGVIETTTIPGAINGSVYIDGVEYASSLLGEVSLVREDNAAATFAITINSSDKPASFLNKEIKISFQVADMNGVIADYIPVFTGLIKNVTFKEDQKTLLNLTGYDYGGVHGSKGELISQDITPVLTGSIYISAAGTYVTTFAPIWNVTYEGEADIEDGRDWFVDTLNGEIIIPLSSNFITNPGTLNFSYAQNFDTLKELIETVAAIKGWDLQEDGVTIDDSDYTAKNKQPVLSLSNESCVDIVRKFLELTGGKIETNLYPHMRIYSETINLEGVDNHIIDDTAYEDSLNLSVSLEYFLNEQTVNSVAKSFTNIEIGDWETLEEKSGFVAIEHIYTLTLVVPQYIVDGLVPKSIAEVKISKANVYDVTHTAGGILYAYGFTWDIKDADWIQTYEDDSIVFRLTVWPQIIYLLWGYTIVIVYPEANWTLSIQTKPINYGEGAIEETVSVTATRPVTGIDDTLAGDVYEHPWIESPTHAGDCANAILTEAGNIYSMSCEIPIDKAASMRIGDKINVKRGVDTIFKGIIKLLDYRINTETAEASVAIEAKGGGIGI